MKPLHIFEAPFAPTSQEGADCQCVSCGTVTSATLKLSEYPHRYIPKKWVVHSVHRGLLCSDCHARGNVGTDYVLTKESWHDGKRVYQSLLSRPLISEEQRYILLSVVDAVLRAASQHSLGMAVDIEGLKVDRFIASSGRPMTLESAWAIALKAARILGYNKVGPRYAVVAPTQVTDALLAELLIAMERAYDEVVGEVVNRPDTAGDGAVLRMEQLVHQHRSRERGEYEDTDRAGRSVRRATVVKRDEQDEHVHINDALRANIAVRMMQLSGWLRLHTDGEETVFEKVESLVQGFADGEDADGFHATGWLRRAMSLRLTGHLDRDARWLPNADEDACPSGMSSGMRMILLSERVSEIEQARGVLEQLSKSGRNALDDPGSLPWDEDREVHRLDHISGGMVPSVIEYKRESVMSEKLRKQGKDIASSVGLGMQLAAANEAGEVLVDIAKEMFADSPMIQLALQSPDGKELAKFLMAVLLQTGAEQTNLLPNSEAIAHICKLQMAASTQSLVAPRMNKLRKQLTKLAKLGTAAGAVGEKGKPASIQARFEEDDDDAVEQELEKLKAEMAEMKAAMASSKKKGKEVGG